MRLKEIMQRKHQTDINIAAYRAVKVLQEEEKRKRKEEEETRLQNLYQKSRMNHNEHKAIYKKVKECMENEKPYTNPNLRLTELASMVDTTPSKLSQMFNQHLRNTFFDFINLYRVEEFKRRMTNDKHNQYTITSIAESCGFKRSSFFATFKKFEQCTPTEWLQKLRKDTSSKNKIKTSKDEEIITD